MVGLERVCRALLDRIFWLVVEQPPSNPHFFHFIVSLPNTTMASTLYKCMNPQCTNPIYFGNRALTMHIMQSFECTTFYCSTFMNAKENHGAIDQTKQLVHLTSTVNANDNVNDNEEGGFEYNNEGDDDSMPTLESALGNGSANATILDPNVRIVNQVTDSLAYSNDRHVKIALLKILNDVGAPLYAFSSVIGWAENAYQTGYRFNPRTKHFDTMMKELQDWTQLGDLRPTQKMVTLAKDGFQVPVVCFDFPTVICSLFNDPEVNQLKNLIINQDDPFGKYISPDGKLGDVNSAKIYDLAYDHCCTTDKDFLALVILYMDKTVISQTKEGLSALPVMVTVATFNCEVKVLIFG